MSRSRVVLCLMVTIVLLLSVAGFVLMESFESPEIPLLRGRGYVAIEPPARAEAAAKEPVAVRDPEGERQPDARLAVGSAYSAFEQLVAQPLAFTKSNPGESSGVQEIWTYSFPAWSLMPPLPVGGVAHHPIVEQSSFYRRELSQARLSCLSSRDKASLPCVSPIESAGRFHPRDCGSPDSPCGAPEDFIPMVHEKYLTGSVAFLVNGVASHYNVDCGWGFDYQKLLKDPYNAASMYRSESALVYLVIPDGYSFQHFVDGVLPKLVLVEPLLRDPKFHFLLDTRPYHGIVPYLLRRMGIESDRIVSRSSVQSSESVSSPLLVMPCRAPPLHPYLWRRAQYLLRLPFLQGAPDGPPLVVYLSRRSMGNKRNVQNDADVENELRRLLEDSTMELQIVDHSSDDYDSVLEFFSRARILIGPHGGAFVNMLFVPPGAKLLEFQISSSDYLQTPVRQIMHRQAVMLGHDYYSLLCKTIGNSMRVDLSAMSAVVSQMLRELDAKGLK